MSQESDEMREEYDIRGGVRGKYYQRYMRDVQISAGSFPDSSLVANSSASATKVGSIMVPVSYGMPLTSSRIEMGEAVAR